MVAASIFGLAVSQAASEPSYQLKLRTCPGCGAADRGETRCSHCGAGLRTLADAGATNLRAPPPSSFRVVPAAHEQHRAGLDPTGLLNPLNIMSPLSPLYIGRDTSDHHAPPPPPPSYDPPAPSPSYDSGSPSSFDPGYGSGW